MTASALDILAQHNLRKTAVRAQVLDIFLDSREALSHNDIEAHFDQVDRITLYRTLKTFEEKGVIHKAIDGGEKLKYALCSGHCSEHAHEDHHAHFHCDQCGKTVCIESMHMPTVQAPAGYQLSGAYLVLKGTCATCS